MLQTVVYYLQFGQAIFLLVFLVPFLVYFAWKVIVEVIWACLCHRPPFGPGVRSIARALLIFLLSLFLFFWAVGWAIERINSNPASRTDIAANDQLLMQLDQRVFGVYVPFWLQDKNNRWKPTIDAIGPLLLQVYYSVSVTIGLMLLVLFAVNSALFLQMLAAFFLCILFSVPMWYFFPALSPLEGYVHPVIHVTIPHEVDVVMDTYQPTQNLDEFLQWVRSLRDTTSTYLAVTTIPSMHVAWVTLLLYFGLRAWLPSVIILLPYFFLNSLATIYSLQHYAVDIPAGTVVAVISIALARRLSIAWFPNIALLAQVLQDDLKHLRRLVRWLVGYVAVPAFQRPRQT